MPQFQIKRPRLNAVERGALLYCYGQSWNMFALTNKRYVLAEQFDSMPTSDVLTSMLNRSAAMERRKRNSAASGLDVEFRRLFGL